MSSSSTTQPTRSTGDETIPRPDQSPSAVACPASSWLSAQAAHQGRADALTAGHRDRRSRGQRHAVEDFLYEYYGTRPSLLRRWHPGAGVGLAATPYGPAPHTAWRWYRTDADGTVALDVDAYLADRGPTVTAVHRLLSAVASRPAFTGCFGLHEWAMVYREDEHRHPLPLRLGKVGTDAVVESHPVRCSHFDAFRFFTPEAVALNQWQPTRATQVDLDQPGCLHVSMDLHKWATQLGPVVPGDLALDCFELARDIRTVDMRASPYDLSAYGEPAVPIETPAGKARYVAHQKEFSELSAALRARLVEVCARLLDQPAPDRRPLTERHRR